MVFVFMDMLDKGVVVFLDDILIYSTMVEEHFELLEKVFAHLHKYKLYCKKAEEIWLPAKNHHLPRI